MGLAAALVNIYYNSMVHTPSPLNELKFDPYTKSLPLCRKFVCLFSLTLNLYFTNPSRLINIIYSRPIICWCMSMLPNTAVQQSPRPRGRPD